MTKTKTSPKKAAALAVASLVLLFGCTKPPSQEQTPSPAKDNAIGTQELLNVSYDVSRDFYKAYNPLFLEEHAQYKNLTIKQSHGSSSKQAQSIAQGLKADVATMNQASDIELLVKNNLVLPSWQNDFPNHAVPFSSVVVFVVRQGNPKQIKDWSDLTKDGTQIVIANPKTTGNGRYAFLGAYGYAHKQFAQDPAQIQDFGRKLLSNVVIFDNGGRAASTSFAQRGLGDVLITFENEAHNIIRNKFKDQNLSIVYPSYTIVSENPVAQVNAVTAQKNTQDIAKEYLSYLWSDKAQALGASFYLRPSNPQILAQNSELFPEVQSFDPTQIFGSWEKIMSDIFGDGGVYDTLVSK